MTGESQQETGFELTPSEMDSMEALAEADTSASWIAEAVVEQSTVVESEDRD